MYIISMWIFSLGIITSSLSVITSIKPVNGIISLILVFINGIGIFMITGQDFIGLIYCIVYVGAIAILFLFIILLLYNSPILYKTKNDNIITNSLKATKTNNLLINISLLNNKYIIILIGILFLSVIYCAALQIILLPTNNYSFNFTNDSGLIPLIACAPNSINDSYCQDIAKSESLKAIANIIYSVSSYELLLAISLILLVGMIGAIVLTLKPEAKV